MSELRYGEFDVPLGVALVPNSCDSESPCPPRCDPSPGGCSVELAWLVLLSGWLAVMWLSGGRTLERDEDASHASRADAALHFNRRYRLQLPPLLGVLVEGLLQLVSGHLAADQALAKLDHLVLESTCHAPKGTGAAFGSLPGGPLVRNSVPRDVNRLARPGVSIAVARS